MNHYKELSKEDKKLYSKLASMGTIEDMFEFGYAIGGISRVREELKELTK